MYTRCFLHSSVKQHTNLCHYASTHTSTFFHQSAKETIELLCGRTCSCLTLYARNSNLPTRIRCYKIKWPKTVNTGETQFWPRSSTNEFDASYALVRKMKEGLVLDIRHVEDDFGPFLLPLSNFHGCACAIAFPSYSAVLMAQWKHFRLISLFHGHQTCHEHENCPSLPR